jgi:maleate isomerase
MLTPSSNTVLEPMTNLMLRGLPEVSVHFARFRVKQIGLDEEALNQFEERPMLEAAELLADAKVDVITWNGTSAGWRGLDADRRLCALIFERTGVKATTSALAMFDLLRLRGESRIGLVTPYTQDVQIAIVDGFAREGVTVVAERHSGLRDNFSFAQVTPAALKQMIYAVAAERPEAIVVLCTNLAAASFAETLEANLDITIYDSVATALYGALSAAEIDTVKIQSFGRIFASVSPGKRTA